MPRSISSPSPITRCHLLLSLLLFALSAGAASAGSTDLPFLSPLFGDHMVLQRGAPNRIWGWTTPGAEVRVAIEKTTISTTATADGRWQAEFTPPPAGGPYTLTIDGPQQVALRDILVGDIWLCSGQSNMEMSLERARNGTAEVQAAAHPAIRLFKVATRSAYRPIQVPTGKWQVCTPDVFTNGGGFSAVAYFFARKIHAETGVPIGLIQSAVGGTPAETWVSPDSLRKLPEFVPALDEISRLRSLGGEQYGNYVSHWYDEYDRGQREGWARENFDDASWTRTTLKTAFADLGVPETPAVCWLRREISLPDPLPPGTAKIHLGVVEKMDTVHLNGPWIGASSWVENPRVYTIRENVLHPGKNLLTIRVLKTKPDGGFRNSSSDLKIILSDGTSVLLEGAWRGKVAVDARPPHPLPMGYENYPTMPSVLANGMIQPLAPLAITGVLWYQGEANQFKASQYPALLKTLIADWRSTFRRNDLPFYIVGLPAFTARKTEPPVTDDGWTKIREAQAIVARTTPHVALATIVDTGDASDIHPVDKQPVGERLALIALKDIHGRNVVCSGPVFDRLENSPSQLRIHFSNTQGGLVCKGERFGEFAVSGPDGVWHPAEARIDGNTIVLTSPKVPNPVHARYAWQANPLATLYNGAGLPAVPFCSDRTTDSARQPAPAPTSPRIGDSPSK